MIRSEMRIMHGRPRRFWWVACDGCAIEIPEDGVVAAGSRGRLVGCAGDVLCRSCMYWAHRLGTRARRYAP